MSFKAVVSGSALQPDSAPEMLRPIIEDLNNRTVADLLSAIDASLATPWQFEGGWSDWFYAIFTKVADMVGRELSSQLGAMAESYQKRLVDLFKSQGYTLSKADEMANYVCE